MKTAEKTVSLTDTQKYALYEAMRIAYANGWKGKRSESNAPTLVVGSQPTYAALVSKGMADDEAPVGHYRRTYPLTKAGIEAGEQVIEQRGGRHPRAVYLDQEKERAERDRLEKEMRERVATALAGLKLPRTDWQGKKQKPLDIAKDLRGGVFPQIGLEDLDVIITHLTKRGRK